MVLKQPADSIIVRAKESTENVYSANATISITITAVNDAPLSPDSAVSVDEGNSTNLLNIFWCF